MPCGGYEGEYEDRLRKENRRAVRAACDMARAIRKYDNEMHTAIFTNLAKETRVWVKTHDKADAKRLEEEKKERKEKHLRKKALRKLTKEERELLRIA